MATVAIDLGADRTRLAVYDRRTQRPTLRVDVPTLAHVPRAGPIRVGDAAVEAIKADPVGAIHDLKSRLCGMDFVRNHRRCHPADLVIQLFTDLRERALRHADPGDTLVDCCLAIPLQFDTRQSESIQETALLAGFSRVSTIDAPIAALRHYERQRQIDADHAIVCDLGRKARIAVLIRDASFWRADHEIHSPREWEIDSMTPSVVLDTLERIASQLSERKVAKPPLLLVGGNVRSEGILEEFPRKGWNGAVVIPNDPAVAIVLGAVDV